MKTALILFSLVAGVMVAAQTTTPVLRNLYTFHVRTAGNPTFPAKLGSLYVILLDPAHISAGHNQAGYNISMSETPKQIAPDRVYTRQGNSHIIPTQLAGAKIQWIDRSGVAGSVISVRNVTVVPTHIREVDMRRQLTKVFCTPEGTTIPSGALTVLTPC